MTTTQELPPPLPPDTRSGDGWFFFVAVLASSLLVFGVLAWRGAIDGETAVAIGVVVIVVALLLVGAGAAGYLGRAHRWLRAPSGNAAAAPAATRLQVYWFVPVTIVCVPAAVVLIVIAVMEIGDLAFDDVLPWLLLGGAAVLLVLALIAASYAPPGPNWAERVTGLDGSMVLLIVGTVMTVFGTFGLFDFGAEEESPTTLWVVLIAGGLLVALSGMAKGSEDEPLLDDPTSDGAPPDGAEGVPTEDNATAPIEEMNAEGVPTIAAATTSMADTQEELWSTQAVRRVDPAGSSGGAARCRECPAGGTGCARRE